MPNQPTETVSLETARRVAHFIHDTRFEDLPEEVVGQARRCFLDLLSSSFAGIPSRTAQIARNFAASLGGTPECSLFGDDRRVPLPLAVFANATVCEALDCDDGYNPLKGHPGAFLLPVVLAFAERDGLSGSEVLTSLVIGYEIAMRSGLLVHRVYGYYHGSGSWGGLGTAAIAARLLHLGEEATFHALGAAEYHATLAPIMRCVSYPGMTKDGVGWGAFAGVSAALLAHAGFTAPPPHLALQEAEPEMRIPRAPVFDIGLVLQALLLLPMDTRPGSSRSEGSARTQSAAGHHRTDRGGEFCRGLCPVPQGTDDLRGSAIQRYVSHRFGPPL